MGSTKVTFEAEDGRKAICNVNIDRDENTLELKIQFEPAVTKDDDADYIWLLSKFVQLFKDEADE